LAEKGAGLQASVVTPQSFAFEIARQVGDRLRPKREESSQFVVLDGFVFVAIYGRWESLC